jgi:hypothetical protein
MRNGRYDTYWNVGLGTLRAELAEAEATLKFQQNENLRQWMRELNEYVRFYVGSANTVSGAMHIVEQSLASAGLASPAMVEDFAGRIDRLAALLRDRRAPSVSGLVLPLTASAKVKETEAKDLLVRARAVLQAATGGRTGTMAIVGDALSKLVPKAFTNEDVDGWWRELSIGSGGLNRLLDRQDYAAARVTFRRLNTLMGTVGPIIDKPRPGHISADLFDKLVTFGTATRVAIKRAERELPTAADALREAASKIGMRLPGTTRTKGAVTPRTSTTNGGGVVDENGVPDPIDDVGPGAPEFLRRLESSIRNNPVLWLAGAGAVGLIVYKVVT